MLDKNKAKENSHRGSGEKDYALFFYCPEIKISSFFSPRPEMTSGS
jgi:hypothetical protein